jgi:hypothetical protein
MTTAQSPQTEREPRTPRGEPDSGNREKNHIPVVPPTEPQPVPVEDPPETRGDPHPYAVANPPGMGCASRLDRIARRVHQIHEARGGGYERGLSDWLQAEREIDLTD